MTKKVQSQLQLAADRVREMKIAVDASEKNLLECQLAYHEARRNLLDTEGFLAAQKDKLNREIQSIRTIVGIHSGDSVFKECL